jgi:hypothetical protein
MEDNKKQLTYKREKGKIEISGDQDVVKWPMWVDMILTKLQWTLLVVLLLFIIPKASFLPVLWLLIKRTIPLLIFFVVVGDFMKYLLSG